MCSICLSGLQVTVEGEDWMVLAIDKYDYGIFTAKPLYKLCIIIRRF